MVWPKSLQVVLVIAILIRLLLAPLSYHDDTQVNYWWGKFATEFPLRGYYDWLEFGGYVHPDQPVLYILFYASIRHVWQFSHDIFWYLNVHIPAFPSYFMQWYFEKGNLFLEKIPIIFSDLILIFLAYKFLSKKIAFIFALFPPLIYNTAVWGGNDSLLNLLGLSALYFLYKKRYIYSSILFALCFLFKTSLVMFLPIVLIIFIKNKPNFKNIFFLFIPATTLSLLLAYPFSTYFLPTWIFNLYTKIVLPGAMHQITSNALNFWALIYGLNPLPDDNIRLLSLFICFILYIYISVKLWKNFQPRQILLSLVQITLVTFTFMTRMHERYTFPALIPLLVLSYYDRSYFKYFILLTLTHMLNVYNLWWVPNIPLLITFLKIDLVIRIISLINTLLALKLLTKNVK